MADGIHPQGIAHGNEDKGNNGVDEEGRVEPFPTGLQGILLSRLNRPDGDGVKTGDTGGKDSVEEGDEAHQAPNEPQESIVHFP